MRSKSVLASTIPLLLMLAGCAPEYDNSDLRAYMDEVYQRPKGKIEPIPQEVVYEPFTYVASNKRSPFQPPIKITMNDKVSGRQDIHPDETRVKQFLEGFNMDSFTMVGTLNRDGQNYALIKAAESGVHRVKVGDYLGANHGRITEIKPAQINVIEIVESGDGGWLERPRTILLQER
ncbi:pilus assembly protein PilP [Thiopseudomonas alkaliphila]|uniref:Pilus assembly protein PilP n=1 Tax=Thiopseudomonas alkaliphila TaxID=1697053 RepID=A0AAW7DQF1_9GAMM|nr:pilus assembly protein PilP [Thiopseudomonas alkaliphila]MDM1695896.1 pilus assembly protein PilP [Thiopseudomonas alkaliphila]